MYELIGQPSHIPMRAYTKKNPFLEHTFSTNLIYKSNLKRRPTRVKMKIKHNTIKHKGILIR